MKQSVAVGGFVIEVAGPENPPPIAIIVALTPPLAVVIKPAKDLLMLHQSKIKTSFEKGNKDNT